MTDKLYLGISHDDDHILLDKHTWDCDWYWGFGYIGNNQLHMHISAFIDHPKEYIPDWTNVDYQFSDTWLTQEQWWILRDLFIQAYALGKAAEVYAIGGHQTEQATPHRIISETMVSYINADLENLLDIIWDLLTEWKAQVIK